MLIKIAPSFEKSSSISRRKFGCIQYTLCIIYNKLLNQQTGREYKLLQSYLWELSINSTYSFLPDERFLQDSMLVINN